MRDFLKKYIIILFKEEKLLSLRGFLLRVDRCNQFLSKKNGHLL